MSEPSFETRFVLATLATWRLAHLIALEDGPGDVVLRLRLRLGDSVVGRLMDCFFCISVWVAIPATLTVAPGRRRRLVTWLALSGAAGLLERATDSPVQLTTEGRS